MIKYRPSVCRGDKVWEISTGDVRVGDKLMCWLSDATACVEVTGWTDHEIDLTKYGLYVVVHREFSVRNAPWWVDRLDRTGSLDGKVFILARC